jgi:hypothetical protein
VDSPNILEFHVGRPYLRMTWPGLDFGRNMGPPFFKGHWFPGRGWFWDEKPAWTPSGVIIPMRPNNLWGAFWVLNFNVHLLL